VVASGKKIVRSRPSRLLRPNTTIAFGGCEPSPGRTRDARQCAALAVLAVTPMLGSRSPTRDRIPVGDH
jgi:hypothetical protein